MPRFGPTKRRELIALLRGLGFEGPYSGGKHEFMQKEQMVLAIPNPHRGDIGPKLLACCFGKQGYRAGSGRTPESIDLS